jgi:hypothetical protein
MIRELKISIPERIIPSLRLWSTLAVPPGAVVMGSLIGCYFHQSSLVLASPFVAFPLIFLYLQVFVDAVGERFEGRSYMILGWAYFFGQTIFCFLLSVACIALFIYLN